ncbi:MAG: DUF5659 domain-containing protein [Candidatus Shapirobacteria bacterium]|nr:DUF5659 domain-containing protein [Candidatus Shapirobacteria bacterium]
MNLNEDYYKTSDLALVTALSLYYPIESLETVDNRKIFFVFKKTQELENLIGMYWNSELKVEPQQFFNQLKVIKTRIYSQQ